MPVTKGRSGLIRKRSRSNGWTAKRRALFLDELATSCNVRRAAAAAGMHRSGAHALRRRDAEFADLWTQAIEEGADRLEREVLANSLGQLPSEDNPGPERSELPAVPFDAKLALDVLKTRAATARRNQAYRPMAVTDAEMKAALAERFAVLARVRAKRDADT